MGDSHECGDPACAKCYGSPSLTAFHTGRGVAYLDVSEVVGVSAPVSGKGGFGESRRVLLRGGGVEYILNTAENYAQLGPVLGASNPATWKAQDAPGPTRPVRAGRKGGKARRVAGAGAGGRT
jgi:hypothetical protein